MENLHPIKMIIDSYKGRYTLGDKLQQHATHRSDKSLRVYLRIFVKIVVSATEFCRSNMLQKIKSDRICVTCRGNKILLQRQRFFHKISPVHPKWFVSMMCCHNMLQQLVARPVLMEWSVAMTCCCNLSPSVYRPLSLGTLFSFNKILELYSFWKECLQWVTLSALDLG